MQLYLYFQVVESALFRSYRTAAAQACRDWVGLILLFRSCCRARSDGNRGYHWLSPVLTAPPNLFPAETLLKPEAEPSPAGLRGSFRRREQPQTAGKFTVCRHLTIAGVDLGSRGGWMMGLGGCRLR